MGEDYSRVKGISLAPKVGLGFMTDGKLLDFDSPFPHGVTKLLGAELTLDFQRLRNGNPQGESGQLALVYFHGTAHDKFDQDDLPLSDEPILPELQAELPDSEDPITAQDLIRFSQEREASSHLGMVEWRWPSRAPAYRSKHWLFIHPRYTLGVGLAHHSATITVTSGAEPLTEDVSRLSFFVTGSFQVDLVAFKSRYIDVALGGGIRVFAGQLFGMTGEGQLGLSVNFSLPAEDIMKEDRSLQSPPLYAMADACETIPSNGCDR